MSPSGSGRTVHVQAVGQLEPHVDRGLVLELEGRVGEECRDLHLVGAQLDGGCLVTGEDLTEGRIANAPRRLAGGVVTVKELLCDHAVLVGHVDSRERHTVEALPRRLLRVVWRDERVEDAELPDDRRAFIRQEVVGHLVLIGERQELLLAVIADSVDADTGVLEEVQVVLQLDQLRAAVRSPDRVNTPNATKMMQGLIEDSFTDDALCIADGIKSRRGHSSGSPTAGPWMASSPLDDETAA